MSDDDHKYKGPGELTTGLGTAAKGYIAGGAVGAGVGALAHNTGVVQNAAASFGSRLPDAHWFNGLGSRGRAAVVVGGAIATVGALTGLVGGWMHAGKTKKTWTERENERAAASAMLNR